MPDTQKARHRILHKMIDKGLVFGANTKLSKKLKINRSQLSMAMTGFRTSPKSIQILNKIESYLDTLPNINK